MSTRSLSALALLALLLSGCSQSPPGDVPEAAEAVDGDTGPAPGPAIPWTVSQTADAWFLAAKGVPFESITVVDGCELFGFEVPEGSSTLAIRLAGDDVAADAPGAGRLTFMHRHADAEWTRMDAVPAGPEVLAEVTAPAPGDWQVWVWPVGAVANVHWDLEVTLSGLASEAPGLEVRGTGFSC